MKLSHVRNEFGQLLCRFFHSMTNSLCLILSLFLFSGMIDAAEIDFEVEAGVGSSDNIARTPDTAEIQPINETLYSVGLNFDLEQRSRKFEAIVGGTLFFIDYGNDTYDSQVLGGLDFSGIYRITDETVSWFLQDNFGQQAADPFLVVTPDNLENINYLTTGPRIEIPIGSRFSVGMEGRYSSVRYEEQPLDSERLGVSLGFNRQISATRNVSLNVSAEHAEYESPVINPDVDFRSAFMRIESVGGRNQLNLDLGWTGVEQADQKDSGPLLGVEWTRQISEFSDLLFNVGTRYNDSAGSFRYNQEVGGDLGGTQDQQTTSNPFRENYSDLIVSINKLRTRLSLTGGWSREAYTQQTEFDRRLANAGITLSRDLSQSLTAEISANWYQRQYENIDRTDDNIEFRAALEWQFRRTLRAIGRLEYFDQDSNIPSYVFTEMRAYIGLAFTPQFGD